MGGWVGAHMYVGEYAPAPMSAPVVAIAAAAVTAAVAAVTVLLLSLLALLSLLSLLLLLRILTQRFQLLLLSVCAGTGSFGYTHARPTLHAEPVPSVSDVRTALETEHPIARLVAHGANNPLLSLDGRTRFISRSQGAAIWRLATQQ